MIIELDKSKSEAGQQRPTDFLKSRAIKMKNGHLCVKSFWLMVSFSTDRCLTMVKPTWICLNIFDHQSLALEELDRPNPEPTPHTLFSHMLQLCLYFFILIRIPKPRTYFNGYFTNGWDRTFSLMLRTGLKPMPLELHRPRPLLRNL